MISGTAAVLPVVLVMQRQAGFARPQKSSRISWHLVPMGLTTKNPWHLRTCQVSPCLCPWHCMGLPLSSHHVPCSLLTAKGVRSLSHPPRLSPARPVSTVVSVPWQEDKDAFCNSVRNEVKQAGLVDTMENCWDFFIDKVRTQHIAGML